MAKANKKDKNAKLETGFENGRPIGLSNPYDPATILCLYIYQMENFASSEMNQACRTRDRTKL